MGMETRIEQKKKKKKKRKKKKMRKRKKNLFWPQYLHNEKKKNSTLCARRSSNHYSRKKRGGYLCEFAPNACLPRGHLFAAAAAISRLHPHVFVVFNFFFLKKKKYDCMSGGSDIGSQVSELAWVDFRTWCRCRGRQRSSSGHGRHTRHERKS